MFTSYYTCYDEGELHTYNITSVKEKNSIYNIDEKELQIVYICNVFENNNEEDKHVIYIDSYDYESMVKNKVSVLTRHEDGKKGFTNVAIFTYVIFTVIYIIILLAAIYNEKTK
jgi:hypothetical protein